MKSISKSKAEFSYRWWGPGELNAFFGLLGDAFSKISAIIGILLFGEGFPKEIVLGRILPGIAIASVLGNLWYFYEAYSLAHKEKRSDVTAQPFGISSTQVFSWLYLIIIPIYRNTGNAELAWQIGLAASLIGGIIEAIGAFIGKYIIKIIPSSALLGNMAASALIWLSFNGILSVFENPIVALVPFFLIVIIFNNDIKLPKNIPASLLVILIGTLMAWLTGFKNIEHLSSSIKDLSFYPPNLFIVDAFKGLKYITPYLQIIIPLEIANFIATLQGVESAALVGDEYPVKRSMLMDGISTIIGSLFGNPFPTTVYWGHPGWKKVGARGGYSLLVGLTYISCFFGLPQLFLAVVPYEIIVILLIYIGITVTTEVMEKTETKHFMVMLISLFPILAQFIDNFIDSTLLVAGLTVESLGYKAFIEGNVLIKGIKNLSYGAFSTSLLFAIWTAYICDKEYRKAAFTSFILTFCSLIGLIHTQHVELFSKSGVQFGLLYGIIGICCFIFEKFKDNSSVSI